MVIGRRIAAFNPRTTVGTKTWKRKHPQWREWDGSFLRNNGTVDLEAFCVRQLERLKQRFRMQDYRDQQRQLERWAEGQWVGRDGLELQEDRR